MTKYPSEKRVVREGGLFCEEVVTLLRSYSYLTAGPADEMARSTHQGQAFWGGSGPPDKTCLHCAP
jgi:hypothetical protein